MIGFMFGNQRITQHQKKSRHMKQLLLAVAVLCACGAAFAANTSVAYPAAVGGVVTLDVGEGDVTTYTVDLKGSAR